MTPLNTQMMLLNQGQKSDRIVSPQGRRGGSKPILHAALTWRGPCPLRDPPIIQQPSSWNTSSSTVSSTSPCTTFFPTGFWPPQDSPFLCLELLLYSFEFWFLSSFRSKLQCHLPRVACLAGPLYQQWPPVPGPSLRVVLQYRCTQGSQNTLCAQRNVLVKKLLIPLCVYSVRYFFLKPIPNLPSHNTSPLVLNRTTGPTKTKI